MAGWGEGLGRNGWLDCCPMGEEGMGVNGRGGKVGMRWSVWVRFRTKRKKERRGGEGEIKVRIGG